MPLDELRSLEAVARPGHVDFGRAGPVVRGGHARDALEEFRIPQEPRRKADDARLGREREVFGRLQDAGEERAPGLLRVAAGIDAAPPGQILVSATTARKLRNSFPVNQLPPLKVKGKAEPIDVYEVVWE